MNVPYCVSYLSAGPPLPVCFFVGHRVLLLQKLPLNKGNLKSLITELIPYLQVCAMYSLPVPQPCPKLKVYYSDLLLTLAPPTHWAQVTRCHAYFLSLVLAQCQRHSPAVSLSVAILFCPYFLYQDAFMVSSPLASPHFGQEL